MNTHPQKVSCRRHLFIEVHIRRGDKTSRKAGIVSDNDTYFYATMQLKKKSVCGFGKTEEAAISNMLEGYKRNCFMHG